MTKQQKVRVIVVGGVTALIFGFFFSLGTFLVNRTTEYSQRQKKIHQMNAQRCHAVNGQYVLFGKGGDYVCVAYPYQGDKP